MKTELECMRLVMRATFRWVVVETVLSGLGIGCAIAGIVTAKVVCLVGVGIALYLGERATVRRERLNGLFWRFSARGHQRMLHRATMLIREMEAGQ